MWGLWIRLLKPPLWLNEQLHYFYSHVILMLILLCIVSFSVEYVQLLLFWFHGYVGTRRWFVQHTVQLVDKNNHAVVVERGFLCAWKVNGHCLSNNSCLYCLFKITHALACDMCRQTKKR